MSTIIVTGGAGYIGSHTVVELFEAGYKPIIIDNFINSEKKVIEGIESIINSKIKVYEGDCNDASFMQEVFDNENDISGCIHFAAYKAVGESVEFPLTYYHNNINSLLVLIQQMLDHKIANLVFSSSCTVYGQPDTLPVTEESPEQPAESPYGNTKQICEEIIEDTTKSGTNLKCVSLRYFNPIGAHESSKIGELPIGTPNNLVPFITQTAAGLRKELTVFGDDYDTPDGSCIRDYIHVKDLSKAHVRALEYLESRKTETFYDIFNLGTGKGNSVLEVIDTFEKVTRIKLNFKIGPRREGDIEKVWADTSKANNELNWTADSSLEKSLEDSWNWQKSLEK
jgi:UDP-glucose 4-epimerase